MTQSVITFREAQGNFFDREIVQRELGREVTGAMARVGAFVRTTAQRSIRPARRWKLEEMPPGMRSIFEADKTLERPFMSSSPGEPPRGRSRRLKRSIYFAWDERSKSGVVGPIRFPGSKSDHAPSVLEFGGDSWVSILPPKKKKKRKGGRVATDKQAEGLRKAVADGSLKARKVDRAKQVLQIPVKIDARPYMGPALRKVQPRIQSEFRNLIRGNIR